jgi:hypothetical protein
MSLTSTQLLAFYKGLELVLLFWLLALLFKWVLTFIFGEKGACIIGVIGHTVNFAIKKFILEHFFKITVDKSDPFQLEFVHEETKRWDVLFTAFILIPTGLGIVLGVTVSTIGLLLEPHLSFLSIVLYIIGFLISVNCVPTLSDVKELKDCSVRSIVIWFMIATIGCAAFSFILYPFLGLLGIIISFFIGTFSTTMVTFFIAPISERMDVDGSDSSFIGGTVDLDG